MAHGGQLRRRSEEGAQRMIKHVDLGFEDAISVVISGEEMSRYMGIDAIEAEHVTLELLEWH